MGSPIPFPIGPITRSLGLTTYAVNRYSDSASWPSGGIPHDAETHLLMSLRKVVNNVETDYTLLPTYEDRLLKFHVEGGSGDNADVLDIEFDDGDDVLAGTGYFSRGAAISVAMQYTVGNTNYTSCIGVYFITQVKKKGGILYVTGDNLITILKEASVKSLTFDTQSPLAVQIGSYLTQYEVPYTTDAIYTFIEANVTMPDLNLWQMLKYAENKMQIDLPIGVSGTFRPAIRIGRNGKIEIVKDHIMSIGGSYKLLMLSNDDLISDIELTEDTPYNQVVMMYSSSAGYLRSYEEGQDTYTVDNPFDTTSAAVSANEWRVPKGVTTDIHAVEALAPYPFIYESGNFCNVAGINLGFIDGTITKLSLDYEGMLTVSMEFTASIPLTPSSTGSVSVNSEDKLGNSSRSVKTLVRDVGDSTYVQKSGDTVNGRLICENGLRANYPATQYGQVVLSNGSKDIILREDSTDFYILISDAINQSWNDKRPLRIDLSNGKIYLNDKSHDGGDWWGWIVFNDGLKMYWGLTWHDGSNPECTIDYTGLGFATNPVVLCSIFDYANNNLWSYRARVLWVNTTQAHIKVQQANNGGGINQRCAVSYLVVGY